MILLSNVPGFVLRILLIKRPGRNWIYLGNNQRISERLKETLPKDAVQLEYARKLYDISNHKRDDFVRWIDEVSLAGRIQKEWLFSVPAVKNPYSSNLFLYINYFFIIKKYLCDNEKIDCVFVDSPALGYLLKRYFPDKFQYKNINYVCKWVIVIRAIVKSVFRLLKCFFDLGRRFLAAKIVFRSRAAALLQGKENIVLIRNYITGKFSDTKEDILEKHFFPGLYDYLKNHRSIPVFLCLPVKVKNYRSLFRKVKASQRNIIFVEEFLKIRDYIYSFLTPTRALRCRLSVPDFCGYNFSLLLKEEYYTNLTENSLLSSSLFSCFGKRFKEKGLTPSGIINWSEFQAFEKGLISGLREAFENIKVTGSQPFTIPPNHISLFPSRQDRLLKVVPDKILVLGPIARKAALTYTNNINIDYTPAFRYHTVFQPFHNDNRGRDAIVLFGYGFSNAVHIMRTLANIQEQLSSFDNVFIKLHPAANITPSQLIKAIRKPLAKNFKFVDGRLEDFLHKVSVGICGATGTSVELVLRGIPVILIAEIRSLTMNYLTFKESSDTWRMCFSEEEIISALRKFKELSHKHRKKLQQKALEFRTSFFAEPDERYWENYLMDCRN